LYQSIDSIKSQFGENVLLRAAGFVKNAAIPKPKSFRFLQ
jgi:hypothetical protein